jgi:2-polyprenyl-6-methoxyphenol hydroxylase-like FAD-dependent oxidoreductase
MKQTEALVVGGSIAGLALAASLQKQGIEYVIIEITHKLLRHGAIIMTACICIPTKGFPICPIKNLTAKYHAIQLVSKL